jgi:hypothetical protein
MFKPISPSLDEAFTKMYKGKPLCNFVTAWPDVGHTDRKLW